MGNEINTEKSENRPYVSPDGKYFFFTSSVNGNRDIYWVDSQAIEDLRKENGMQAFNADEIRILDVLRSFQDGYSRRDTNYAEEWCEAIFYNDVEIIGTYSVHPDSREWFSGRDKAIDVFKLDWIHWGDFKADIEKANINIDKDLAWVSFEATITKSPDNSTARSFEQSAANILRYFSELSKKEDSVLYQDKLREVAYYTNLILYQYSLGDEFIWPLRITAVLQKKDGKWKIRQIHFSHPNRGFPNVRY